MRRYFGSLCGLLFTVLFFVSCLSTDEDDTTLYSDTALTSFYISTAKIYNTTTSSTGADSVYYTTNSSMSDYPFHIDQLNDTIYNVTPLPYGTDVTKLLCSYSTKNNGVAYIENLTGDSLKYLSTTDSTDFSSTRKIRVYASDVSAYRSYSVTVKVRKVADNTFTWNHIADDATISTFTAGLKAVAVDGNILLFGSDGNQTSVYSTSENDGTVWTPTGAKFNGGAYCNVALKGDTIYVLDNDTLKVSPDGATFSNVNDTTGLRCLLGASNSEMYGIHTDSTLMVSTDDGITWVADDMDDSSALLPSTDISFCCADYEGMDSTDYVFMAGNRSVATYSDDTCAVAWNKVVEYSNGSENNQWVHIDFDSFNLNPLPRLSGLNVFGYNGNLMAIGGSGIGKCKKGAFSAVYESRDGGITWKQNSVYALPDDFDKTVQKFTVVVDSSDNIWIVCGGTGQVWRGKLNDMDEEY